MFEGSYEIAKPESKKTGTPQRATTGAPLIGIQAVAYFVTVCTQGSECLFGDVVDDETMLNGAGRIVQIV